MDLIASVFSEDVEVAAAAVERLCEVARDDVVLVAALGSHTAVLPRLAQLLQRPAAAAAPGATAEAQGSGAHSHNTAAAAHERLQMYAAYLVSILAGRTAAIDAKLLDQRFIPVLVAAAAAACSAASS